MRVRTTLAILLACSITSPGITAQTPTAMRYSVQIASLGSLDPALEAGRQWASLDVPVYVVPTEVQGITYYRVMAGMLATRQEAVALMSRLVAQGIKESANAWDVRDANFAFTLGIQPSEADAERARDEAHSRGVPAYIIPTEQNGALAYQIWAGGFANVGEAAVLQGLLERQGGAPALVPRRGLDAAAVRTLADRPAPEEAEQPGAEPAGDPLPAEGPPPAEDPPPTEDPPATGDPPAQQEPPRAELPEQDPPPVRPSADPEPAREAPLPEEGIPPTPTPADPYNFTSIFVAAVGTATEFGGGPSASSLRGYGGAVFAGLLLGGFVEVGGHGGVEYVSQDGAFGTGASTATVLTYSGFGGLYAPALVVGGASVRLGGRGGWSSGRVRITVQDLSSTVDLETGAFVEPVLKVGSGSLGLIGAFRYFLEDASAADWTASLGIIWGT